MREGGAFRGLVSSGFKPVISIGGEQLVGTRVLLERWAHEAEKSGMKQLFFVQSTENPSRSSLPLRHCVRDWSKRQKTHQKVE